MLTIAILAGGLATRLRPITETIPKALIEVAGKPFIDYQLTYLSKQGIKKVVLCVGYLGSLIQEYVGTGFQYSLDVEYSFDGDQLLGTGGALKKASDKLGKDFFVQYGDSFLPINYKLVYEAYLREQKPALLTIYKNDNKFDRSNVCYQNQRLTEYNKNILKPEMNYIDYGLSILNSSVIEKFSVSNKFDLSDVYNELSLDNLLAGYVTQERFYEIGSHQGIKETENYFSNN